MEYEKEYIEYLVKNINEIDSKNIDLFFLNKIDFETLLESIDFTKNNLLSFNSFTKSKKIDYISK